MKRKLAWVIVIGTPVLVALLIWVGLTRGSCAWYGYQTDRETRYAAFVGCLVQTPRGWTPRDELRTEQ